MTTVHKTDQGILAITKGAAEVLLDKLEEGQKSLVSEFEYKVDKMAGRGYRVLGYAVRLLPSLSKILVAKELEKELILIAFVGMIDPPREEAKQAVRECKEAGIIPVMITGNHKLTAQAIANQLGILFN